MKNRLVLAVAILATAAAAVLGTLLYTTTRSVHAQDWAKARVDASPRHREYVKVTHDGRTLNTYVVYPEVSGKAPVIVLIHEIFGMSDWTREMADDFAAQGYIAVLPDLLSGSGPNGGGTESYPDQNSITRAVSGLPADQVNADLNAVADYAKKLPAASGKLFVAGFCWGGGKSFDFATHRHDLSAAFVFYGTPPSAAAMASITAPVYGFYAGNDARVSATVPQARLDMAAAHKPYEAVIYPGAGHGFMRAGEDPAATPPNKAARDQAFARTIEIMKSEH